MYERLDDLLNRYGEEIEYDLQSHCNVDLAHELRAGRVRRLLNLIGKLPNNSHYFDARAHDIDQARYVIKHPELMNDAQSSKIGEFASWTPTDAKLADVIDLLQHLIRVQLSRGGVPNLPKVVPSWRPVGAIQDAQEEADQEHHDYIVSRVTFVDE